MDGWVDQWGAWWIDRRMDGWLNEWVGGWVDGWVNNNPIVMCLLCLQFTEEESERVCFS